MLSLSCNTAPTAVGTDKSDRYTYDKQYHKTLEIYLSLRRGNAFQLIKEHNLFDSVRDKVALLMEYDKDKAVQLLVANTDRIPVIPTGTQHDVLTAECRLNKWCNS
jgi:hypothetical protein